MNNQSYIKNFYDNFYYPEFENLTTRHDYAGQFLEKYNMKNQALLDVGCYRGYLFRMLREKYNYNKDDLYGIDISDKCIKLASIYTDTVFLGDVTQKEWEQYFIKFNIKAVVATEILEHVEDYNILLSGIANILSSGGLLIISFPNYFNVFRFLKKRIAELINNPKMIYLQPIEKEYNYFKIKKDVVKLGFKLIDQKTGLFLHKNFFILNKILNYLGLHWLGFCPVMVFKKN